MRYTRAPKRTDTTLNFDTYYANYNNVKRMLNLKFDPSVFYTIESPDGIYITTKATSTTTVTPTTTIKRPFDFDSLHTYTPPTDSSSESSNSEDDYVIALKNNFGSVCCRILDSQVNLTVGDNVTYDSFTDRYLCNPPGIAWYIYLALDRKNGTATINANDFFPGYRSEAGDHKEYIAYKLLYLYDGTPGETSTDFLYDMRNEYTIEGMV